MAPTTHDVIPIRDTQHYWGLHPHDDITIGKGGRVHFRTAVGFHDIATVSSKEELDACNVSNPTIWVDTSGDLQVPGAGDITKEGPFYEFTYSADTPGVYYIVCTVSDGSHCKTGQKITLTVTDDMAEDDTPVKVMGSAVPFWTVGVGYSPMTIDLGDSLRFVSDDQGYHDVALLDASKCGAFDGYSCCNPPNISHAMGEVLYNESDFIAKQEYIWTPDATGSYEVVCSVWGGVHCQFGQRFNLTVKEAMVKETNGGGETMSGAVALQGSPFLAFAALIVAVLF
mmetsp:Transcript_46465/g.86332  ORF Transcript_46465/g.86332 Transcript_46465/m.86332 type:complete len:284 (-) Transcript_46465:44-895(-)